MTYKAAIIGLGNIGMEYDVTSSTHPESHTMAYALNDSFQLVCAMDVQEEKKQILYRFSSGTAFYTDIEKMFKNHPDIDIVSICTPPQVHLSNLEYLIRHTDVPYIFCEKPLISSLDELTSFKNLLEFRKVMVVPNISRRWSHGIQTMRDKVVAGAYGELQKVFVRYTRGIYNTGAHLFDLLRWCGVEISQVQVIDKVYTTSEKEGEASFSFTFNNDHNIRGYVEAFDDTQYYCFDIAFYFSKGKIDFKFSGNDILYYSVGRHHLFPEFPELTLETQSNDVLADSCLAGAMENWTEIISGRGTPRCSWEDSIYPLCVARALESSYKTGHTEKVHIGIGLHV